MVFALGSSQSKVDHVGKKVNEDFKYLGENQHDGWCLFSVLWQWYYLEEHSKGDAKEKGQNTTKRTPHWSTIAETPYPKVFTRKIFQGQHPRNP